MMKYTEGEVRKILRMQLTHPEMSYRKIIEKYNREYRKGERAGRIKEIIGWSAIILIISFLLYAMAALVP